MLKVINNKPYASVAFQPFPTMNTTSNQHHLPPSEPKSSVRLFIECSDLIKMDTFSDSDPYVVVEYRTHASHPWQKVARTETLQNNHFPKFSTPIELPYYFERMQMIKLSVFDEDEGHHDDFLGEQVFYMAEVVTAQGATLEKDLDVSNVKGVKKQSKIKVSAQELTGGKRYMCQLAAYKLPISYSCCWCVVPPTPGYRIFEISQGIRKMICGDVLKQSTINPVFPPMELMVSNEAEDHLCVEVYDQHRSGKQTILGETQIHVSELVSPRRTIHSLEEEQHSSEAGLVLGAELVVEKSIPLHSFFEYFANGGNISLAIAIDFTASNGLPTQPGTLHFRGHVPFYAEARYDAQYQWFVYDNPYQRAIHEVVSILDYYDSDHRYPVYGFGAKVLHPSYGSQVSHCFPLPGQSADPYVEGVKELFTCYANVIKRIEFWGPTLFAPVVNAVNTLVREQCPYTTQVECKDYTILLIITDGQIMDMDKTKKAIIDASELPISIIIIGVGNEDFSSMVELDSDDAVLQVWHEGRLFQAKRDIVQFVSMNSIRQGDHEGLVKEVLAEIPKQYIDYLKLSMERKH